MSAQTGVVKFAGQAVPGATVTASEGGNRVTTTTDESGRYELSNLAPGSYTIEVRMFGFQNASRPVQIGPGAPPVEWTLELQPRPRELAQRSPQQPGGFRNVNPADQADAEPAEISAPPQDTGVPADGGNEAFLVNGTLSSGLQNG